MTARRVLGIILLAAGLLALVYGGFSYTQDTHQAKLGPLQLQVKEKDHVNIPPWAGVVGVVGGIVLLVWKK